MYSYAVAIDFVAISYFCDPAGVLADKLIESTNINFKKEYINSHFLFFILENLNPNFLVNLL